MAELKIGRMILGMCQTNCYFLYREGGKDAVVVDPADKGKNICEALKKNGFRVEGILLTHGHFDHIWGLDELRNAVNAEREGREPVKAYACAAERELLGNARLNVSGGAGRRCETYADVYVNDGEEITLGAISCRVIATPGHTEGGCCYYLEKEKVLFSGDTLFCQSVGRTDFPGGSMSGLVRSIKEKLLTLPDDVTVYPGHMDITTIGRERNGNPFL